MTRFTKRAALIVGVGATLACGTQVQAQDAAPNAAAAAGGNDIEEVIVTARKRSESVQDIPVSVRAIGEKELLRLGADSLEEFSGQTPGLTLNGNRANTQITIRGVTTGPVNHDQTEIKETVGLYIDESPIAVQRYSPNLKLYDLERVEVLRGPQGTLYGAGSMAGAIRLITNKPDTSRFDASAKLQLADVDHGDTTRTLDAMVNIPLVPDVFAVRAVGFYKRNAGFIDNVVTHQNDVNSEKSTGGRIAARYTPGAATTVDALISYQKSDYNATSTYAQQSGFLNTSVAVNEPFLDRNTMGSLSLTHNFDAFDVTAVGSYRRKRLTYFIEDGTFTNFITGKRDGLGGVFDNRSYQRDYSGELRFASKAQSTLQWTVGAFYENRSNFYSQDFTVPGVDAVSGIDSRLFGTKKDQLYASAIDVSEKQVALFGEVVIPFAERFKATLGGRYFDSKQNSDINFAGIFADPNIGLFTFRNKENGFNPRLNLAYEFDRDHMIYAQAAKGFRLGGTNEPVPIPACQADLTARGLARAPDSYKSDSLWNYEVGAKTMWLDRRFTLNVAAYKIKWRDPQVTAQLGCGFNVYVNAGGLDITGTEIETIIRPVKGLTLRGGIGYADSKLTEDLTFVAGRKGDHAPFVPKWTYSASLDYTRSMTDKLEGFAFFSFQNTGDRNTRFNTTLASNNQLPAYSVINARFGVNGARWTAELFAENLGNSRGISDKKADPFKLTPATFIAPITPRTVGLELTLHY